MPRGGKRPNSGRPKGSKTLFNRTLAERGALPDGPAPLDILLSMARDKKIPPDWRIRAAIGAAPYMHRRKPQAVEVMNFEFLSPEDRENRRKLLLEEIRSRAPAPVPQPAN